MCVHDQMHKSIYKDPIVPHYTLLILELEVGIYEYSPNIQYMTASQPPVRVQYCSPPLTEIVMKQRI